MIIIKTMDLKDVPNTIRTGVHRIKGTDRYKLIVRVLNTTHCLECNPKISLEDDMLLLASLQDKFGENGGLNGFFLHKMMFQTIFNHGRSSEKYCIKYCDKEMNTKINENGMFRPMNYIKLMTERIFDEMIKQKLLCVEI